VFYLRKKEANDTSVNQVFNKKCSGLNLLLIKDIMGSVLGLPEELELNARFLFIRGAAGAGVLGLDQLNLSCR